MRSIANVVRGVRSRWYSTAQRCCAVSYTPQCGRASERFGRTASAVAAALAASAAVATPCPSLCWVDKPGSNRIADPENDESVNKRAELIHSIKVGDVARTFRLLDLTEGYVDAPLTSIGQTALAVACAAGVLPLVAALIEAGADVNAQDRTGASCLSLACTAGHSHVVQRLLGVAGADPGLRDIYGLAAIHKAVGFGMTDCLRCLLQRGADPNLLTGEITAPPEYEVAPALFESALHIAARLLKRAEGFGSTEHQQLHQREILEVLIHHGADALQQDGNGNTPMHFCARGADLWGLWLLLGSTSDARTAVLAANEFGTTVLDEADSCGWEVGLVVRAAVQARVARQLWKQHWSGYHLG